MFKKIPLHQYFFFLLVILLPTQLSYHFWPESAFVFGIRLDYLAPTVYLTDILVVLILLTWMWEERRLKSATTSVIAQFIRSQALLIARNIPLLYLSIYLIINAFLVAQNQPAALYKLVKLAELFLLGLYVSRALPFTHRPPPTTRPTTHYSLLTTGLSLAVIYSSVVGIAQTLTGRTLGLWLLGERTFTAATPGIALQAVGGQEYLRAYSTFSHPNSFAGFLLVAACLLLPWKTTLTRVVAVLGTGAFILTFSQGAWFAAVLLMGLWFIQKLRVALIKPYAIGLLVLAAFLTTSVFWWNSLLPQTQEVILRQGAAMASLQMIYQTPLFGVGLNNFIVRLPEFSSAPQVSWFLQPVHNIFLLVTAETGFVGLALFLWLLFLAIRKLATGNWQLVTALLAILLTGSLDHYWLTLQQNMLLASIVFGGIFSKNHQR